VTYWQKRTTYIEEQVKRAVMIMLGVQREHVEWHVRRHAANLWHEMHGGET
jgi:hypothetical protein